jgi:hypothetical protein
LHFKKNAFPGRLCVAECALSLPVSDAEKYRSMACALKARATIAPSQREREEMLAFAQTFESKAALSYSIGHQPALELAAH